MKRAVLFITIALITYGVIYFARNPEELNKIWLYGIGLFGIIVKFFSVMLDKIKMFLAKPVPAKEENKKTNNTPSLPKPIVRG